MKLNTLLNSAITSQNSGDATIIGINDPRLTIQFINTGNIKDVHRNVIYNGSFSDTEEKARLKAEAIAIAQEKRVARRMTPSVQGVGFLGIGDYKASSPFYRIWADMFRRCYDLPWQKKFPTYKGCSVDPRWHNFQTFCDDFPYIEGYQLWKESGADLDKDIKFPGNKIYSLQACKFVTREENVSHAMNTRWSKCSEKDLLEMEKLQKRMDMLKKRIVDNQHP